MSLLAPLEPHLSLLITPRGEMGNASHEVLAKLEHYAALLVETNRRMNLVASSTLPELWKRHFWDSVQLFPLLPLNTQILVDLGSGAGFPGLVLAIMGVPEVHLVESVGKKANFLKEVAQELAPSVTVHHARAEDIRDLQADVVTARAVTALPDLLSLSKPFFKKETVGLFLKGEKADAELTASQKYWTFDCEKKASLTDSSGTILRVKNLKVRRTHEPRQRPR